MNKYIALLLVISLVLSLTACAVGSDDLMENITPNTAPSEYTPGKEAQTVTDFGLRLFRESYSAGENTLISPLSVLCALAMTANGAEGETLAQMEAALGLDTDTLNNWIRSYMAALPESKDVKLNLANSIWFKDVDSFTVNQDFLQTSADYYGAGIFKAPFDDSTCREINKWVEDNTDGMIKDILDEIPESVVMYLVNALAFEAQWEEVYKQNAIWDGEFTTENGFSQTVEMMHSDESLYLDDGLATGFIKYYEGGDYAFAALLPNEGVTVEEYLNSLTGEALNSLLANADHVTVQATMPKFELEYSVELSDILKKIGMNDAFYGALADFSGLGNSTEGNIYISRVLHKTYICVDGKGTKAGAATVVEMETESAMEPDFYVVNLDRPFVYLLIDTRSNLPFFIGTMMDPSGEFLEPEEPVLEDAPDMTFTCGDDSYTATTGNYSWTSPGVNGEMMGVVACGTHPLDGFRTSEFCSVSGNTVTLSFPVDPDEITVIRWPKSDVGNIDKAGGTVKLNGLSFAMEDGSWVYQVIASWNRDAWSGTAEYHLFLTK